MSREGEYRGAVEVDTVKTFEITSEVAQFSLRDVAAFIARRIQIPRGYRVHVEEVDNGNREGGKVTAPFASYKLIPVEKKEVGRFIF